MREQVVTPRANGRSAVSGRGRSSGIVQKPVRRGASSRASDSSLRAVLAYLPLVGKILLAIVTGVLIFAGYRAAASASFFEAKRVDVGGTSHTSADEIKAVVRRSVAATGVWQADLEAISAEIEKLPWVRKAIVSRVLPDGLRVRVLERVPRAVVRTSAGKFIWVDEDAVSLGLMTPTDKMEMPPFFIRGWDEAGTSEARADNRERVRNYLEMAREWGTLGLTERVSEVNLGDLHDVRALLGGDDAHIEVRLGERNFGSRLQKALKVLDEQRSTPLGPFITYLVANQDGKITVGHSPTAPALKTEEDASSDSPVENNVVVASAENRPITPTRANKEPNQKANARKESDAKKKKERDKKEKSAADAKKETRPRRVG